MPVGAQAVEAKAVKRLVDFCYQPRAQSRPLRRVDLAFKDRLLHALPEVEAGAADPPQAAPAGRGFSVHVIGDEHQQVAASLPDERRIAVQIAAQVTCQQLGLGMRQEAERHGLVEKRVAQFVALALLSGDQNAFSTTLPDSIET